MKTEFVHRSMIQPGDCIVVDGAMKTVSKGGIRPGFMGVTIFGDSFKMGTVQVERCLFPKWLNGNIISYHAQI